MRSIARRRACPEHAEGMVQMEAAFVRSEASFETARSARVEMGFVEYCKVGVPLTLVTLLLGWLVFALLPA